MQWRRRTEQAVSLLSWVDRDKARVLTPSMVGNYRGFEWVVEPADSVADALRPSRSVESRQPFDDHGHSLAAAYAPRFQSELLVMDLQIVDERRGDAGTAHAEGMTQGDRTARDVEFPLIDG